MIAAMSHETRIKIAAVATAAFIGGLTAVGLNIRPNHAIAPAAVPALTRTAAPGGAKATLVSAPHKVTSRVSPAGASQGDDGLRD
jgi:hypothetical protein